MLKRGLMLLCLTLLLLLLSSLFSPRAKASAAHVSLTDDTIREAVPSYSATASPLASGGGYFNVFSLVRLTSCVARTQP